MSEGSVAIGGADARKSMIRVWMAVTGIWVVFWMSIAALIAITLDLYYPFSQRTGMIALIILGPPLALLAIGVAGRWIFETFAPGEEPRS